MGQTDEGIIEVKTMPAAPAEIKTHQVGMSRLRRLLHLILNIVLYAAVADRVLAMFSAMNDGGDTWGHAGIAALSAKMGLLPANFGIYLLACVFAYPHPTDTEHLFYVLLNIMLVAVILKLIVTRRFMAAELKLKASPAGAAAATIAALALLIAFSFPFDENKYYLGQFPPNIWHNSTTIAVMPLAFLLFWSSYKYFVKSSVKLGIITALLCAANAIVKPSFLFPFVMIFPVLALWRFRFRKPFWGAVGITLFCLAILAVQTYYTYYHPTLLNAFYQDIYKDVQVPPERITLSYLTVWRLYSSNLWLSLFYSVAFPLSYIVLFFRRAFRDFMFVYALGLFIVGLLLTCCLMETGFRKEHANFFWQTFMANYVLFAATLTSLFRPPSDGFPRQHLFFIRRLAVLAVFALHVVAGLWYFHRAITTSVFI